MATRRFPSAVVEAVRASALIGMRAGIEPHRFIGIWAVVVDGRVFVRSWAVKPHGWYRALLREPRATIQVGRRKVRVRAVRTRSEHLKSAVDRAYLKKYTSPGSTKFARDLGRARSRATTTELVPP